MTSFITKTTTSLPVSFLLQSSLFSQLFRFLRILLIAGVSILVVVTVLFFIMKQLPGGEPLLNEKGLTQASKDSIIATYGLGDPLFTQYGNYLRGLFNGTFGLSMLVRQGVPVESFIWSRIQWSVAVSSIAIAFGLLLSFLFTFLVAFRINGISDRFFTFLTALFTALPAFIFTTILLILASTNSKFPILFEQSNFISWFLPIIAVGVPMAFTDFWYIRSQLVRLTSQQFVKFAAIKGMTKARIIVKHLIPQSLLPIAVRLPLMFAGSVTLTLLVEATFGIPGAGQIFSTAITTKDYNVIMAIVIVQVFLTAFAYPLQDVLVRLVDPTNRRKK